MVKKEFDKMRVAFVANSAWYLRNFRMSTLQRFVADHEVFCLYPCGGSEPVLNSLPLAQVPFYLQSGGSHPLQELRGILALWYALKCNRPQVVFSFNPKTNLYALMCCWVLRIPCIPNVSGVGAASTLGGIKGRIYRSLAKFFYRRAAHVYFQNRDDCQAFVQAGWIDEQRLSVIPGSGVDLSRFSASGEAECARPLRLLMGARLLAAKGVCEYLTATRHLLEARPSEVECWLAGSLEPGSRGVDEDEVNEWSSLDGAHYLGHVEDMPSLLSQVDVVVLPSYYPEGIPRSLIEAAASGKLLITTDMPGCREVVIPGENGYLVRSQDVGALYQAMLEVLDLTPSERESMGKTSRVLAESRYDENVVIRSYLDVLADI